MKKIFFLIIGIIMPLTQVYASKSCSDEVFVRRAYLATTGALPTPEKCMQFFNDNRINKREVLIKELLNSELHRDFVVMHWGDILRIKSEFPSNLWPNGVQAYNRWIYAHILHNTPYNLMIRELLLSQGSNFRSPAVNFYRGFQQKTANNFYTNINLLFLGTRNANDNGHHCFSQIKFKSTKEWKEEIIYLDIHKVLPEEKIQLSDGTTLQLEKETDWRTKYVDWLTSSRNRRFAEVMVNRIWYWVFGKGIVNEVDDWRKDNPPTDAKLLKSLTDYFISSNFNMKLLWQKILLSDDFQDESYPVGNYKPQRLPAEVIVDAIASVTGSWQTYHSRVPEPFTYYPPETRAIQLGDGTVSSTELELFGKVSRDVSLESQRNNTITSRQLLYLMNSSDLEQRIRTSQKLKTICQQSKNISQLAHAITLLTLSRKATPDEITLYKQYKLQNKMSMKELATDILWMQINSNEFLYNH